MDKLDILINLIKSFISGSTRGQEKIFVHKIKVTGAGDFGDEFELDKKYIRLTGINISKPDNTKLSFKTFNCNGNTDTFAEGVDLAFIATDMNVSPEEKFYLLDLPADGNKLNMQITDDGNSPAYPYTLTFHLRLQK